MNRAERRARTLITVAAVLIAVLFAFSLPSPAFATPNFLSDGGASGDGTVSNRETAGGAGLRIDFVPDAAPLYFERGAAFDFSALPENLCVRGTVDGGMYGDFIASVAWSVTDENRAAASDFRNFTVTGDWTTAKRDTDGAETLPVTDAAVSPALEIRFCDRRAVGAFSVTVKPLFSGFGGAGKLLGVAFLLEVSGAFAEDAEVDFEYSDGGGYRRIALSDWDYSALLGVFDNSTELFLGKDGVAEAFLSSLLNDRFYYRLNVKNGLFQGISNTVTIEGGVVLPAEDPERPGESGIGDALGGADGSRGGGASFWSTPSGTAAGIGISAAVAVVSIAAGFGVSVLIARRKRKKNEKADN